MGATHLVEAAALVSITLAPAVWVALLARSGSQTHVAAWVYWQVGLIFLLIVEFVFVAAVAFGVIGALLCAIALLSLEGQPQEPSTGQPWAFAVRIASGLDGDRRVDRRDLQRSDFAFERRAGGRARFAAQSSRSAWRFAAPLDSIDLPREFPDPRGDREIDVVVLGESSAAGVPFEGNVSVGEIVCWKLEQVLPGRPIRLRVLARAGDTLERQHQALASLDRRPDLVIVYCGHNEFYSRLWWSRNLDY